MTVPITTLGVLGDIHAEDQRLLRALDHLANLNPDAIICTGDIVDGMGCPNTSADYLQENGVLTVRGNHDRWILEDKARHVPNAHNREDLTASTEQYLTSLPSQITLDTVDGKLMLCHGIGDDDLKKIWPGTERMEIERSRKLDKIIDGGEYRYIINGHMHFRTLIHFEHLTLMNAGTLKGSHWPGFSLINFEIGEVTAFEFHEDSIRQSRVQALYEDHHKVWHNTQSFCGGWDPVRLFEIADQPAT